jgi:hypothetical protein
MAEMAAIDLPFIQSDSPHVYHVRTPGHTYGFYAPMDPRSDAEAVYPFRDSSGAYFMDINPANPEALEDSEARRLAGILEPVAKWVRFAIDYYKDFFINSFCAASIMAWYLIDDEASIARLCDTCDYMDYNDPYTAVWATFAVFRNSHSIRDHLSNDAKLKYLHCYTELGHILQLYGVTLYLNWW